MSCLVAVAVGLCTTAVVGAAPDDAWKVVAGSDVSNLPRFARQYLGTSSRI